MKKLTQAQLTLLEKVYRSEDPVTVNGNFKRTVEVLARRGLIKYEYLDARLNKHRGELHTQIKIYKKASVRKVSRILAAAQMPSLPLP